ncbi:Oidioi.mRNA.OKI2018_I69.XSR.g14869.t1.cds [Oikopleura dioica]|uniref:Oidioi.mRNA.OKI2018_I69.XSR.g14869.t1.cds n=1 Tax=Oikopleura dioica TaxID=34765 RepID=A0ABN7SK34_OIKDI|nr:Oidioi.mRNA.OKI2018_I69.XSR.g14869.t1.cds [Oikopleura dioica]
MKACATLLGFCTFSDAFEFEKADREKSELFAEMANFKSSISNNEAALDKLSVFKELVQGAWDQTINNSRELDALEQSIDRNSDAIVKENVHRQASDKMLFELFQSVLEILNDDSKRFLELEKSADTLEKVEVANAKAMETRVNEEISGTRRLLDSHAHKLNEHSATLETVSSLEKKLQDLEFQVTVELAKSEARQRTALVAAKKVSEKSDEDFVLDYSTPIDTIELEDSFVTESDIKLIQDGVTEEINVFVARLEGLERNVTALDEKYLQLHQTQLNITEISQNNTLEILNLQNATDILDRKVDDLEQMINRTVVRFANQTMELATHVSDISNLTDAHETELFELRSELIHAQMEIQNLTDTIFWLQTENEIGEEKDDVIKQLQETVIELQYGLIPAPKQGEILITGGLQDFGADWSSMLLSVHHRAQREFTQMPLGRSSHCLVRLDDDIFALGGAFDSASRLSRSFEWKEIDPMLESRDDGPGCATYHSRVWVCGGHDGQTFLSSCESYHPSDGWRFEESLLVPVARTTAVVNSEGLFIIGGANDSGDVPFVQWFDESLSMWRLKQDMPLKVAEGKAVEVFDEIYLVGGSGGNEHNILYMNTTSEEWMLAGEMNKDRVGASVVAKEHEIIIIGGEICFDNCGNVIEVFDTFNLEVRKEKIRNLPNISYGAALLI